MLTRLKRAYRELTLDRGSVASYADQKAFIDSLSEESLINDRIYIKYKSRMLMNPTRLPFVIFNIASTLAFLPSLLYLVVRRAIRKPSIVESCDAVLKAHKSIRIDDILPNQIKEEYPILLTVEMKQYALSWLDKDATNLLFREVKMHPICFYMNYMLMLNLAACCRTIDIYNPKAIVTYAEERNFTKPVVLELCHSRGVRYDAFMHGDCFYQIDRGVFFYDTYYVWDKYYEELFRSLKCQCEFIDYTPRRLIHAITPVVKYTDTEYFITYYLGDESDATLVRIASLLQSFNAAGLKSKVRAHPRRGNQERIKALFGEMVEHCDIDSSLEQTYCAVSLRSTVLYEAVASGRVVIIDDVSDADRYRDAVEKGIAILHQPHYLVSELKRYLASDEIIKYIESMEPARC